MTGEDDLCREEPIVPLDPSLSMVFIRDSSVLVKDDLFVFPPMNHENLKVASSSIYGIDSFLESPSGSSSPSSSSRRSASSSSFSLLPSDSDGQTPLSACGFERKPPSEAEVKSPPSLVGESPPSDSESPRKRLCRETEVIRDWWELLLLRVSSKLKNLSTWFSTSLRSYYPVLAIVIWWWMRVRARRRRVTTNHLRNSIKERDERIVQLLHQIAQMNELLINHHKDIVSRR